MSPTGISLTAEERLQLALERIARSFGRVGLDRELTAGLEAVLTAEDVAFAESLARSLED